VIGSKVPSARKPEAIYVIFGRRLRELREKNRLPQEELAAFSGLTRSSIANIENGKQRVMLHQLIKFAEALRVDLDALVPVKLQESGMQEAKQDYLDHLRILARPTTRREPRR
jgi:transcriptional regulator with XRE-family HTH domain